MNICIYGAASDHIDHHFIEETEKLGEALANSGHNLIYGGGGTGLMGAAARGFYKGHADITSVTPHFMHTFQPYFEHSTRTIETSSMSTRKEIMEKNADAFIITPGGVGTLDEFFQVLTLKELKRIDKPIIIFNIHHFYDPVIDLINHYHKEGFIRDVVVEECYKVSDDITEIVELLKE